MMDMSSVIDASLALAGAAAALMAGVASLQSGSTVVSAVSESRDQKAMSEQQTGYLQEAA